MKKILWSVLVLVLLAASVSLGCGWYFSDQIRDGTIKVSHVEHPPDLLVVDIGAGLISLQAIPGTGNDDWQREGTWGLEWEDGYGQVGDIIELADRTVVREYTSLQGTLSPGDKVRLDSFAFPGDPLQAHGIAFEDVSYSSTLGSFSAWYIKGSSNTWVIFIHGRGASRREALRMLPVVTQAGLPSLVITYRNDEGVPRNPDGLQWFGLTEWEDVEGAVEYAVEHGAEDVVLVGYSMGGGIVMEFLYESPLADRVAGVILDSPMLDFSAAVDHGASQRTLPLVGTRVPGFIVWIAKNLSSIRFGIDYGRLDYLSGVDELTAPVLLFQGEADRTVPVEPANAFAEMRPDIVRYVRSAGADHVSTWNVLAGEYEADVRDFLTQVER